MYVIVLTQLSPDKLSLISVRRPTCVCRRANVTNAVYSSNLLTSRPLTFPLQNGQLKKNCSFLPLSRVSDKFHPVQDDSVQNEHFISSSTPCAHTNKKTKVLDIRVQRCPLVHPSTHLSSHI